LKARVNHEKLIRLFLRALPLPFLPGPEIYDLLKDLQRSRTELDIKVRRTTQALLDASRLMSELEKELTQRSAKVNKLQEEYDKYEQLAQVEEKKAEALIKQIQDTLGKGRIRERWVALAINLIAGLIVFALGVFLAPWIKGLFGSAG